ncbi:MAG: PadR family transcriptional regulator [Acidobacteria bacterium]|nr:PadR family transcriptional regulator [Acidobacteriota bacterium]
MKDDADRFLPLTPATLHILLALAGDDLHGYAIMQEVRRQSENKYRLGPGTLYDNLQRLVDQGLVREVSRSAKNADGDDSRRRYYRINTLGRRVLSAEVARLEGVVREAKLRIPLPETRRT